MILETSSILDTIGVKYFVQYYQQPNPRCKPAWWLEVKGKEQIERFISSVQPYLVTKRAHADLLIRLIARRRAISLGAGYKTTVPMVTDKEILLLVRDRKEDPLEVRAKEIHSVDLKTGKGKVLIQLPSDVFISDIDWIE